VLASPVGLALRLQRTSLLWWAVGMFAFGVIYGTFLGEAETFIEELDLGEQFLPDVVGAALVDAFLAVLVAMLAAVTGVYVILATLRLRTEETEGRAEPLLSTAVSRTRWAASHLTIAVAGGTIVLLASVLGLGLSGAVVLEDAEILPRLLGAALAHLPPLWFVAGLSLALFGLLPRFAVLVWALVLYAIFAVLFGELLGFPGWLLNLSPFEHIAAVPAEDVTATPLVVLTVLAAALVAVGLAGIRRRDIEGN
jgi:ABC-2 type transport system permease protein